MAKVILVGADHHNGLGLVRSFGMHSIKPEGIIVGKNASKGFLRHSKYWDKLWFATDEQEALNILLKQEYTDKPVLIPYSDGAAPMIDLNLNELSKRYLCPSIGGKQGEIARLMNKLEQTKLAKQLGLQTLACETVDIAHPRITLPLPLIINPIVSAQGKKADIRICLTSQELQESLQFYAQNGYQQALAQVYLSDFTEYVLTGALFKNQMSFTIVQHIRQWPMGRGSGSFSRFCIEKEVLQYSQTALESLLNFGYQGPIDMEFFKDANGHFYLNEINWRSSGRNFVSLYNGVHSAYFYYCSLTNNPLPTDEPLLNTKEGFSMNEATDFRYVVFGKLSSLQWNKDRCNTQSFALWYHKDLKPTFARYMELIWKCIKGKNKA